MVKWMQCTSERAQQHMQHAAFLRFFGVSSHGIAFRHWLYLHLDNDPLFASELVKFFAFFVLRCRRCRLFCKMPFCHNRTLRWFIGQQEQQRQRAVDKKNIYIRIYLKWYIDWLLSHAASHGPNKHYFLLRSIYC